MWKVVRISPEGYKGFKKFETKSEALEWLESDSVAEDKEYGFWFRLIDTEVEAGE